MAQVRPDSQAFHHHDVDIRHIPEPREVFFDSSSFPVISSVVDYYQFAINLNAPRAVWDTRRKYPSIFWELVRDPAP